MRRALGSALKDSWDGERDPLAALVGGRTGPFEAFVQAETGTFLGFFGRLGARRSEAEDLTQETFLKLFRLAAPRPSSKTAPAGSGAGAATDGHAVYEARGQFRGFAFRVARNVWIDRGRKRSAELLVVDGDDVFGADASVPQPAARLEAEEESSRIRKAVASLSEGHRIVFDLGVLQGLAYSDISAALDIPVGTVKSRMFHAVHRVRESLEESDRVRDQIKERGQSDANAKHIPSGASHRAPNARPRTL